MRGAVKINDPSLGKDAEYTGNIITSAIKSVKHWEKATEKALKRERETPLGASRAVRTTVYANVWKNAQQRDKAKEYLEKLMEGTHNLGLRYIKTDTKRFQNRDNKFSERSVQNIVNDFDPNKLDPVVVWLDPTDNKTYILSGHSRLEAHKRLKRPEIKARYFKGTEKKAIDFALNANTLGTQETPLERSAYYRKKLVAGASLADIKKEAQKNEGKNAVYILELASINPSGKLMADLKATENLSDKAQVKQLEDIASWIGAARQQLPQLTNAHENEMQAFLMDKGNKSAIASKRAFLEKVSAIIGRLDFNPDNALNLARVKYKTIGETRYESEFKTIKDDIQAVDDKIKELKAKKVETSDSSVLSYIDKQIDLNETRRKTLRGKLVQLQQKKGDYAKGGLSQIDIFSIAQAQAPELFKKGDKLTKAEIIQLARKIRPEIQSVRGIMLDDANQNSKVLEPTWNNFLAWANDPGKYDLIGVDSYKGAEPSVVARKVKKIRIMKLLKQNNIAI